ncbi:hypothetical protein [Nonomuraea rubra]|uniref:hypothetical protein n=1 Tax=Nonomuraea rubra TaxID=46180 RepID=UPI003CD064D5
MGARTGGQMGYLPCAHLDHRRGDLDAGPCADMVICSSPCGAQRLGASGRWPRGRSAGRRAAALIACVAFISCYHLLAVLALVVVNALCAVAVGSVFLRS